MCIHVQHNQLIGNIDDHSKQETKQLRLRALN